MPATPRSDRTGPLPSQYIVVVEPGLKYFRSVSASALRMREQLRRHHQRLRNRCAPDANAERIEVLAGAPDPRRDFVRRHRRATATMGSSESTAVMLFELRSDCRLAQERARHRRRHERRRASTTPRHANHAAVLQEDRRTGARLREA